MQLLHDFSRSDTKSNHHYCKLSYRALVSVKHANFTQNSNAKENVNRADAEQLKSAGLHVM